MSTGCPVKGEGSGCPVKGEGSGCPVKNDDSSLTYVGYFQSFFSASSSSFSTSTTTAAAAPSSTSSSSSSSSGLVGYNANANDAHFDDTRVEGQKELLSTKRAISSIPKGDFSPAHQPAEAEKWVYPSEQQYFNAMKVLKINLLIHKKSERSLTSPFLRKRATTPWRKTYPLS